MLEDCAIQSMPSFLSRLRRITSGATWIPEIDGLRFVAIFAVLLYHINGELFTKGGGAALLTHTWYHPLLNIILHGDRGVELFFVISGFILGRPFARHFLLREKPVRLRDYYLRRVTRLEPPYIFNLVVFTIAIVLYTNTNIPTLLLHLLVSVFYLHNLIFHEMSWINSVTWSLEIEIQFYLLVPLLVLLYRIRNSALRRIIFAVAILFFSALGRWLSEQHYSTPGKSLIYATVIVSLQYFLSGLLLSDLYLTAMPRWRPNVRWDLASLLCWPLLFYVTASWDGLLLPPIMIVVFLGAFRGIYFPRFFREESIALIGGMCYTIYLWHFFVISIVFKLTRHVIVGDDFLVNLLLQCLFLLPPVILVSIFCYLLIERPCMDPKWPGKLLAKWKSTADKSAAA